MGLGRVKLLGAAAVLGLAVIGAAGARLASEARLYALKQAVLAIEIASKIPTASPQMQQAIENVVADRAGDCRTDAIRSRVAAADFLVRRASVDQAEWQVRDRRYQLALDAALDALECDPLDGKLWAFRASVESMVAYDPSRFRDLMRRSIETAPFEGGAFEARWSRMAQLPDAGELLAEPTLRADFANALETLAPEQANLLLDHFLIRNKGALIMPPVLALDVERRQLLARRGMPGRAERTMAFFRSLD